jgi:hypothetical protein
MPDLPIVLVEIDKNSRLRILRHEGVMVAFLDLRVDPVVVLLPQRHQPLEIDDAIQSAAGPFPIMSENHDDIMHTASVVVSRLDHRQVVVAELPPDA